MHNMFTNALLFLLFDAPACSTYAYLFCVAQVTGHESYPRQSVHFISCADVPLVRCGYNFDSTAIRLLIKGH